MSRSRTAGRSGTGEEHATAAEGRGGLRVLLVEDNPDERWLLAEILRTRGHTVVACEDAESALEVCRESLPPLVLLDLFLPRMDGLELCSRIRSLPGGDRPVLVAVTGRSQPGALAEVLEAGVDDYVTKPADVGQLGIRLTIAEREVAERAEREETRRALEERTAEIRSLFENLDDVFFSVDVERGRLIQVSPASESVLGIPPERLLDDEELWREVLYGPALDSLEGALSDRVAPASATRTYQAFLPDGSARWLEVSVKGVLSAGELARVDGTISDVTERELQKAELSARTEEIQTLYRISEEILSARTLEEACVRILEEVRGTTGFPCAWVDRLDAAKERLDRIAGVGVPEAWPHSVPIHRALCEEAVRDGEVTVETGPAALPENADEAYRSADIGTVVSHPLAARGRVRGVIVLLDDRERPVDRRLLRWLAPLANSVASLLERMEGQEALRDSEARQRAAARSLRHANQELEAFAYSVSHDLRAPLRTMQGFAHALIENFGEELPAEAADYARRIIESGRRSEALIADLLAYSRLSFEEVETAAVDLDHVVEAVREQLQADLEESRAKLWVEEDLPEVQGHLATLVQVLANLVSNALKFVPEGREPEVRIGADVEDRKVRLWVRDNGIGIPPDKTERIFRPFERLEEGRPGTGIGLAIVRRGVERIGGEVGVESAPGEGSAFWVLLPLA